MLNTLMEAFRSGQNAVVKFATESARSRCLEETSQNGLWVNGTRVAVRADRTNERERDADRDRDRMRGRDRARENDRSRRDRERERGRGRGGDKRREGERNRERERGRDRDRDHDRDHDRERDRKRDRDDRGRPSDRSVDRNGRNNRLGESERVSFDWNQYISMNQSNFVFSRAQDRNCLQQ